MWEARSTVPGRVREFLVAVVQVTFQLHTFISEAHEVLCGEGTGIRRSREGLTGWKENTKRRVKARDKSEKGLHERDAVGTTL